MCVVLLALALLILAAGEPQSRNMVVQCVWGVVVVVMVAVLE